MKKTFFVIFFWIFVFFAFVTPASLHAGSGFATSVRVTYKFEKDGNTKITQEITIENLQTDIYAQNFVLNLKKLTPADPKAYEEDRELPVEMSIDGDEKKLKITFSKALVGASKKRKFTLVFNEKSLATKNGEIWEISIPKLLDPENYEFYNVSVIIPKEFGEESFISPLPIDQNKDENSKLFYFDKSSIEKTGVTAAFGNFQVFRFSLTYHLENPLFTNTSVEIAVPPDTSFQKINLTRLDPLPKNINVDPDGNWVATYPMKSKERFDVVATGTVQIFSDAVNKLSYDTSYLKELTSPTEFWQSGDLKIVALAQSLKYPKNIYDFVTHALTYDTSRAIPNVQRFGALKALDNPQSAICMEFSDLFIAIARAANIPAREVNGYAYTENPQIQPLSLVSDVLHSWVEYWDGLRNLWIPIDPTWGSTTGGVDYFSKLDLRHFTFVLHGLNSEKPYPPGSYKLGPNPQKDVFVSFASSPDTSIGIPQILADWPVKLKNVGTSALYNQKIEVYFDNVKYKDFEVPVLPPYAYYEIPIEIPYTFLGRKTPNEVTIVTANQRKVITTKKSIIIISNLVVVLFCIFSIVLIIYLKLRQKK